MASLRADQTVGVIGAGATGAGIAPIAAAAGHPVRLFAVWPDAAKRTLQNIVSSLQRMVATGERGDAVLDNMAGIDRADGFRVSPPLRRKMVSGVDFYE